ncbi:hypothetical protein GEMRC1_011712 [Eukaryota sp. GEM-RC1]
MSDTEESSSLGLHLAVNDLIKYNAQLLTLLSHSLNCVSLLSSHVSQWTPLITKLHTNLNHLSNSNTISSPILHSSIKKSISQIVSLLKSLRLGSSIAHPLADVGLRCISYTPSDVSLQESRSIISHRRSVVANLSQQTAEIESSEVMQPTFAEDLSSSLGLLQRKLESSLTLCQNVESGSSVHDEVEEELRTELNVSKQEVDELIGKNNELMTSLQEEQQLSSVLSDRVNSLEQELVERRVQAEAKKEVEAEVKEKDVVTVIERDHQREDELEKEVELLRKELSREKDRSSAKTRKGQNDQLIKFYSERAAKLEKELNEALFHRREAELLLSEQNIELARLAGLLNRKF